MATQILVPLERDDRVEEIIPYIEQVTQPGMEVVFLAPYHMDRSMVAYRGDLKSYSGAADIDDGEISWWRDLRTTMESERQTKFAMNLPGQLSLGKQRTPSQERHFPECEYSWANQKRLYQEIIFPFCEPLCKKGCEVRVALYTGSLRKALTNYKLNKDVRLILLRGGIGLWITSFIQRIIPTFGLFKLNECVPMLLLLLYPN